MLYSNLTYLLVARHVENDELALPFYIRNKIDSPIGLYPNDATKKFILIYIFM